jgi:hypothetical protein
MQVVTSLWKKQTTGSGAAQDEASSNVNVIFTTESKAMVQEQKDFASNATLRGQHHPFSFNFVTNTKDVTPDTGFIKEFNYDKTHENTADDAMLSSLSSFKAQMLPRVSIGNCCSNFHVLLNDFLMEGGGAARDNTFVCLQESEDLALRVCCGWHHDCKVGKKKYLEELQLAKTTQNSSSSIGNK